MHKIWISAALLVAVNPGCNFGQKARDDVLLPVLRSTSVRILDDASNGLPGLEGGARVVAENAIVAFRGALESDPPELGLMALWIPVRKLIEDGIDRRVTAGEIGPAVSISLRERMLRFEDGLKNYERGLVP